MADIPPDLRYLEDHHWVATVGPATVRMGVTDFAQESLGDVVEIDLPAPGTGTTAGHAVGEIESTKSVNDLVAPVTGTVSAVNAAVPDRPELINTDPYGEGWLIEIDTDSESLPRQLDRLLSATDYARLTGQ